MGRYIKRKMKDFMDEQAKFKYGYHVTSRINIITLISDGLLINVLEDYPIYNDLDGIILFKTLDDAMRAISSWLGDIISDIEDKYNINYSEMCVKVNLTGLDDNIVDYSKSEWKCNVDIEPSRIVDVISL